MLWLIAALPPLVWLAVIVVMALTQRRFLYLPEPPQPDPLKADAAWMTAVRQPDGALLGWWSPPEDADAPVMLFLHGNRGTLTRIAAKTAPWRQHWGIGILAATYRGYEGNRLPPTEAGLYQDGQDALSWLDRQGIRRDRVVVYGESLGSAIAVELALSQKLGAVVLEAPFTSIADMAAARYPLLPARWLVRDRFDTASKIGRVAVPVLILHGDQDRTTNISHSHHLIARSQSNVKLIQIKDAGHLDIHAKGGTPVLEEFLRGIWQFRS